MKKIKILAVIGSLRKGSLNRQLALEAKAIIGDRLILKFWNTVTCRL
ncbi:hypothetical protein [Thermoclostridium stercorarium]|nr:hypothetical protein [Thermoclostridium stercorarium]